MDTSAQGSGGLGLYRLNTEGERTNFHRVMTQLKFHAAVCIRYHADNAKQRVAHRRGREAKCEHGARRPRPQKGV